MFTLKDLQRLNPTGSGTFGDRHRQLFPGKGSVHDREIKFLKSKGFTVGTRGDRWRQYLSVKPGGRVQEVTRKLSSLP